MKGSISIVLVLGAVIALTSCVSAGFVDFATAEPSAPLHLSIGLGIEGSSIEIPEAFGTVRFGLLQGLDIGVRGGLGTALGDVKYKLPFAWEDVALAIGVSGGANFNHDVIQIGLPIIFDWRLIDGLRLTVSETTLAFLGNYPGFAISGGIGLKWNIGPFYLFLKGCGGYFAPSGGQWSKPGSGIVSNIIFAQEQPYGAIGLMLGFDF